MTSRRSQSGVSLIEVIVVMAIATTMLLVVFAIMESTTKTSLFIEARNDLANLTQRSVNNIETEMLQAKIIFEGRIRDGSTTAVTLGDQYYNNYISRLGPSSAPAIEGHWSVPRVDPATNLMPDVSGGTRYVGNCLLLVRQLPPLLIPYDNDIANPTNPIVDLPADRYRFYFYYLSRNNAHGFRRTMGGTTNFLDLNESRTVDYADYDQVNPIIQAFVTASRTAEARAITNALRAAGMTQSWSLNATNFASAFYNVTTAGTMTAITGPNLTIQRTRSLMPQLTGGRVAGKMDYSVAFRPTTSTTFPLFMPVERWAVFTSGASTYKYPSGFEVKIIGGGANQRVLTRLVLMSHYGVTRLDAQEAVLLTSVRDTLVR